MRHDRFRVWCREEQDAVLSDCVIFEKLEWRPSLIKGRFLDQCFENRLIVRNDTLLAAAVNDHLVMLSTERGRYYDLDAIGTSIWQQLETPRTLQSLLDGLVAIYQGDRNAIETDLLAFLHRMLTNGLIRLDEVGREA